MVENEIKYPIKAINSQIKKILTLISIMKLILPISMNVLINIGLIKISTK